MTDLLVSVERSVVRDGARAELEAAMADIATVVAANEPEILAYNVRFSPDGRAMTVVHVHADQASLEHHMDVTGPKIRSIDDLVDLESIDVYGRPNDDLRRRLREKAAALGSERVAVHDLHAAVERIASA